MAKPIFIRLAEVINKKRDMRVVSVTVKPTITNCSGTIWFTDLQLQEGVMCAIVDKNLSSAVGFKGICRKVLIFTLVGIAHILDANVIGDGSVLRTAVIFFYLSNEGVSLFGILPCSILAKAADTLKSKN